MQEREKRTYEMLDKLGITYHVYHHEAVMTIDEAKDIDEKLGFRMCKNLFLSTRHSTEFYLLVMVGDKRFNAGSVSKQLGVPRLTFAKDEYMLEFLDIYPGSVSPLGVMNDKQNKVTLLVDRDIVEGQEKVAVHPCVNTATVVLSTKDLFDKVLPALNHSARVVEI